MSTLIRDMQGNVVGYQERDGTVRNKDNKKVGAINRRNGTVRDNHNQEVGFIDGDGNVIDRYRRRVGRIGKDGVVEDWHGIALYTGSAAPLLLDFDKAEADAQAEHFDFDKVARQAAGTGATEFEQRSRQSLSPRDRVRNAFMQEGFVSPSILGCLGLLGAVVIGVVILFLFQNPSILTRATATPTRSAALVPADANATNAGAPLDAQLQATPTPQPATGKVNVELLNLRAGPATTYTKIDGLKQDTIVVITGRSQDSLWLQVTVPIIGKDGWVAAQYITTNVELSTLPVAPTPAP